METIDIESIQGNFFLHYGGSNHLIEAEVFAASLHEIINTIEEISYQVSPDQEVIVCIEALHEGSFRPKIVLKFKNIASDITKRSSNISEYLPDKSNTVAVFIAAVTLLNTCSQNDPILTEDNKIIVENLQININTETLGSAKKALRNKNIRKSLAKHFSIIEQSPSIDSFGIVKEKNSKTFLTHIPKSDFKGLAGIDDLQIDENIERASEKIERNVELKLHKIALNKRETNWHFIWEGHKIHGPINDDTFWNDFEDHNIEIGHGDTITADLKIYRTYDPTLKVYINDSYEINNVRQLNKFNKQYPIPFNSEE